MLFDVYLLTYLCVIDVGEKTSTEGHHDIGKQEYNLRSGGYHRTW